jgi:hypothetical protein
MKKRSFVYRTKERFYNDINFRWAIYAFGI